MPGLSTYHPNHHNRKSILLKGNNYAQQGLYFIRIVCKNRAFLFGEIFDGKMHLNDAGKVAEACWLAIPKHFPNAVLHEYFIMPNHIHGIIELETNVRAGAENLLPILPKPPTPQQNAFQKMIPQSIGSIVKGFKIGVTKWFRAKTDVYEVRHRNYYEHIIRKPT